jgi:hypothetical protein
MHTQIHIKYSRRLIWLAKSYEWLAATGIGLICVWLLANSWEGLVVRLWGLQIRLEKRALIANLFPCMLNQLGNLENKNLAEPPPHHRANVFISCRLYPFSPHHHGSVWVLPVISLRLTNTESPVRACLPIWWETFRRNQKEDDCVPLSIQAWTK